MQEIWNKYLDTNYSISSLGRVRNDKTGRILKLQIDKKGYYRVNLSENGKMFNKPVHKLMQVAFNLSEGTVDHLNGVRDDNRIENLKVLELNRDNYNNLECHRNGKLVGACFDKRVNRYRSRIYHNGKQLCLGSYKTALEAHDVYMNYRKLHNI